MKDSDFMPQAEKLKATPGHQDQEAEERRVSSEAKAEENVERVEDGEKQEMTEEEKRAAELRQISADLEVSRKEFMAKDAEMDNHKSVLEKLKASVGAGAGLDMGEFQKEYDAVSANYQKSLEAFKNALISESMGDKEDAEIISKFIEKGEAVNMKKANLEARMDEAPFSEKIKNGFLNVAEKYRGLDWKKKLAIGAGLAGAGFAAGAAGGAMAAGAGTLMLGNRIFSSAVSATGFKAMFDSMAESGVHYRGINIKGENEKAEEATQENIKESSVENGEVDFEKFSAKLNEKIAGMNDKFQKEKYAQKMRTVMAIGAGAAMAGIGKYVGGQASEYIRDHGGIKAVAGHAWDKFWDAVGPSEAGASELPANFSMGGGHVGQEAVGGVGKMAAHAAENMHKMANVDVQGIKAMGSAEAWAHVKGMSLSEINSPNSGLDVAQKMKIQEIIKSGGFENGKIGATKLGDAILAKNVNVGGQGANVENVARSMKGAGIGSVVEKHVNMGGNPVVVEHAAAPEVTHVAAAEDVAQAQPKMVVPDSGMRQHMPTGMGRPNMAEHLTNASANAEKIIGGNIDMKGMNATGMDYNQWNAAKNMTLDEIRNPSNNNLNLFQRMQLNKIVEELGGKGKIGSTSLGELARMAQINRTT